MPFIVSLVSSIFYQFGKNQHLKQDDDKTEEQLKSYLEMSKKFTFNNGKIQLSVLRF